MFKRLPARSHPSAAAAGLRGLAGGVLLAAAVAAGPAVASEQPELQGALVIFNPSSGTATLEIRCQSDGNRRMAIVSSKRFSGADVEFKDRCASYYVHGHLRASRSLSPVAEGVEAASDMTCQGPLETRRNARFLTIFSTGQPCQIRAL